MNEVGGGGDGDELGLVEGGLGGGGGVVSGGVPGLVISLALLGIISSGFETC